ncbi:autotransporter outer membrane beta-barrel domain-containing protein [Fulvivirgaceae bacterium BMA12]|uniref:Autotransporter outer membrane beta-barrel domain-containing protein n=1 Tax=Agaribacillus aureus TaxID=3051825 RepID=A0ABT8L4D5_9BACT|nr:autotransporter outer membrane beta-barrel domain-containing protein [Fulvivirgaceae bacterium BMA12]
MKVNAIILLLCVLLASPLFAQETESEDTSQTPSVDRLLPYTINEDELYLKDDLLLNANFGLRHGKDKRDNSPNTQIEESMMDIWGTAQGGYFVMDRFAIGLGLTLDVEYVDGADGVESTAVDFFGGPFIRWYFIDQLFFQALGGYGIQNLKTESGSSVTNTNFNGIYAMGGLGYDIFLNETKDVALQIGADYVYKNLVNVDDENLKISSGKFLYRVGIVFYFF